MQLYTNFKSEDDIDQPKKTCSIVLSSNEEENYWMKAMYNWMKIVYVSCYTCIFLIKMNLKNYLFLKLYTFSY